MEKREGLDKACDEAYIKLQALNSSSKEEVLSLKLHSITGKEARLGKVHGIATRLAEKLEAPDYFNFFLKCAWRLSENQIECILERALGQRGVHRLYYFIGAAKSEMKA